MKLRHLLWLPLALGVPVALSMAEVGSSSPRCADELQELQAGYDQALATWKGQYEAAPVRERKALRTSHPVHAYWGRFEALANGGQGRAYLWLIDRVKDRGLKRDQKGPVLGELYDALLKNSADAPWLDEAVGRIGRHARYLGEERVEAWLSSASQTAKSSMARALATVKLALLLSESSDEGRKARGEKLLDTFERNNVLEGATALDFKAKTVDGHEFKLSDYRGKVVLVDFYGFW
jgi:hypothetical protein